MKIKQIDRQDRNGPADFAASLKETGFAVLTNHGIPASLLDRVYSQWAQFFKSDNKHAYLMREDHSGYFPFKSENAKNHTVKDLKEFYHVFEADSLPVFNLGGTDTVELKNHMTSIGGGLLGWLEINTPNHIRQELSMPLNEMIVGSGRNLLRILHYPPLGVHSLGEVRAAAHEDINLITLLPAATAPGLEVRDINGNWHEVECDPGALIVNAGDMLQLATGGYYKSTTHRVVNPTGSEALKSRYSMPLFIHPRPEVKLAPGFTADQYLKQRLKELGLA